MSEFGQMNGFWVFLVSSDAVYAAGIRTREGNYSDLLTPAVSENV